MRPPCLSPLLPALLLVLLVPVRAAQAQPADKDWLASPEAAGFRERVVQLALIYGESSGIDPHGLKVRAREAGGKDAGCADVEVVTSEGEQVVRRETVRACKQH
jgi:hypothetical protein